MHRQFFWFRLYIIIQYQKRSLKHYKYFQNKKIQEKSFTLPGVSELEEIHWCIHNSNMNQSHPSSIAISSSIAVSYTHLYTRYVITFTTTSTGY